MGRIFRILCRIFFLSLSLSFSLSFLPLAFVDSEIHKSGFTVWRVIGWLLCGEATRGMRKEGRESMRIKGERSEEGKEEGRKSGRTRDENSQPNSDFRCTRTIRYCTLQHTRHRHSLVLLVSKSDTECLERFTHFQLLLNIRVLNNFHKEEKNIMLWERFCWMRVYELLEFSSLCKNASLFMSDRNFYCDYKYR